MLRHIPIRHPKPGTRPGALAEHRPGAEAPPLSIYGMTFDARAMPQCFDAASVAAAIAAVPDDTRMTWLHFEGEVDVAGLQRLGSRYGLHALALEDIHNQGQRPKLDVYRDHLFVVLALPVVSDRESDEQPLTLQQVSLFFGPRFVLSFHAGVHDLFAPVRERARAGTEGLGHTDAEYLAYALTDVVVDSGFEVIAGYGERIERLEDEIFDAGDRNLIGVIHALRQRLNMLRKTAHAQHETIQRWLSSEHSLVSGHNRPYVRDIEDHARRMIDLADGYHDSTATLLSTHLSLSSMRLNEIMRVLTLLATVFMPLSFIAGIYGMNFDTASPWNMPELGWRYGYPIVLLIMTALGLGMLAFFRQRRWL